MRLRRDADGRGSLHVTTSLLAPETWSEEAVRPTRSIRVHPRRAAAPSRPAPVPAPGLPRRPRDHLAAPPRAGQPRPTRHDPGSAGTLPAGRAYLHRAPPPGGHAVRRLAPSRRASPRAHPGDPAMRLLLALTVLPLAVAA